VTVSCSGNKLGASAFIHDRFTVLHSQCCTPSPVGMIVTLAPGNRIFAHATMWPLIGSADTLLMPQTTWIFERASERIVFTRHKFVGCTVLIVVAPDGITRSKSFRQTEDAIAYQQHLESALTTGGWVLEAVTAPDGPTPVIWYQEAP
jgi:hypothetical protein